MANDLTNVMHKILARGLQSLRETVLLTQLVNTDFSRDAAKKGDVINVPIPTAVGIINVNPGVTDPTPTDKTPSTVAIPLDQWKQNEPFALTDKEQAEIDVNEHFLPMYVTESLRALTGSINQSVFAQYKGVYGYVGTAGTTPFGSSVDDVVNSRKVLNEQLAPRHDRRMVLDHAAEANALTLPAFSDFEKTGEKDIKINGSIGRKFGFDFFADDDVPTHTSGTAISGGSTITLISNSAAGASTVTLKVASSTATLVEGDIITFAGHTQTYAVLATVTLDTTGVAVSVSPGLAVAVDGSSTPVAVTGKASHVVNLAFHRDAFALAIRPLENSTLTNASGTIAIMSDPLTGLALRLEVRRQHKQDAWEFDALWGAKLVRPELASRLVG